MTAKNGLCTEAGLDSCRDYVYQLPTNELIVATGSNQANFWRRAGDLSGADTVLVCTIPVEPGYYSSCRDAAGVRRTAFVPKDSVLTPVIREFELNVSSTDATSGGCSGNRKMVRANTRFRETAERWAVPWP